jgi:formamidopyrimidine-DNA glycosylase
MTGKWQRRAKGAAPPRFSHARLRLDDGSTLHYTDMRRFGRLRVVPGARFSDEPTLAALGPDPLRDGVDAARLQARLARVRLPIKVALLDQTILAGVGNIQASEACFRARLDPRRPARSLTRAEVGRLARAILASIRYTLAQFAEEGADAGDGAIVYVEEDREANPFKVYGRAGEPCPRRNGTIRRIVQAGRSTFFCEACLEPPAKR